MEVTGSLFLSLNFENEVPSRIMLVPADKIVKGRDGREWKNPNPRQTALNSMARLPLLPIDENHSTDLSAPKGGASPALGWMKNLCADASGAVWADVEWTERGRDAILKKEYRFISPVFLFNKEGEINCTLRAALTNSPNLNLPALNSERLENINEEKFMDKALLAALGLPETATEADALAAAKAMNAAKAKADAQTDRSPVDLTAYAPRADLNAMEARASAAEKQLAELNAARLKQEAETAVDEAIKARKFAPASRAEYLALCATEAGLESFRKIAAATPAIIGEGTQAPEGTPPAGGSGVALNAEEAAVARAMGYTVEEYQKIKGGSK
ncbi:MAG: phage protease [Treponema sp.]|jgi:phage I-like protein|nr:phage protease [Treponema sp.]